MALQFLTRIPVPPLARLSPGQARAALSQATAWLPPVGTVIGFVTALVFVAAGLVWPPVVAVLVALAVEAWLTGAFHEDAVADFCDAFGGTAGAEEVRRILKDSRIGSYGTLGLLLAVALRVAATAALAPALAVAAIVAAATVGRLWAVVLLAICPPAPAGPGLARDIGGLPRGALPAALLLAVPGVAVLASPAPLVPAVALVVAALVLPALARTLRRRIGGSTGDCLGFAAYVGQLSVLLAAAAAR
jgi:adenosylcobinamide-GDP ribazoletransferase